MVDAQKLLNEKSYALVLPSNKNRCLGKRKKRTAGYFLVGAKQVDLCTLLYHHGAQMPSTGFGPASHLKMVASINS